MMGMLSVLQCCDTYITFVVCLQESYFKARANAPIVVEGDEDAEMDYDSDGYPVISEKSKVIDPLPPIDHSTVS